jgi:hypothetical protein
MLTRKDFIKFAEVAAAEKDPAKRRVLIEAFVRTGKASNPRFDTEKFVNFVAQLVERM